ncbi:hypothetical protein HYALB_00008783 [Hymenoscyphus albidus]|uniref:Ankyrin n=1 Tax=Hymenoscyphus albidus TaxID=595503 RepID=A0A9N9M2W1_9HELO|nr:hypothetical protein HYALB_00008783 [Hymenoscyphus albidus]
MSHNSTKMIDLQAFPKDIFTLIIEQLVIGVGIHTAVRLRTVNKSFDTAIIEAICVSQVVDIYDPATPDLVYFIGSTLRGKIFLTKLLSAKATSKPHFSVIAQVCQTLDDLIGETDEVLVKCRHNNISEAVGSLYSVYSRDKPVDAELEVQNLLSGAILCQSLPLVKLFVESFADVNGATPYFGRPLNLAASTGNLEIFLYLLDCGASTVSFSSTNQYEDIHGEESDWKSPDEAALWHIASTYRDPPASTLRAAVLGGHEKIIDLLLLPQHLVCASRFEYFRAILVAVRSGRLDLIKKLFHITGKELSEFPGFGKEMIWEAVRCDRKDVVQFLLDNGVDINVFPDPDIRTYRGTLQIAASRGNISMVSFLIERGADINFNGPNKAGGLPIEVAAQYGQEEVVGLLLEHGADPSKALRSAAKGSQQRVVKLLLEKFTDLPFQEDGDVGREALWNAIAARNLTAIALLVDAGISLNDGYEYSTLLPINIAKQGPGPWVVNYLISLGAQETDAVAYTDECPVNIRGILVSERTWEWVSKY